MVRRGAASADPQFDSIVCWQWLQKDETKGVLVTDGIVTDGAALESTQQEADTRVMLHSIYTVQNEDVKRIIIHENDTDIVVTV